MNKINFLSLEQVKELHALSLDHHGGQDGIREPGLLESAVYSPQNLYHYEQASLFEIAAGYAFYIAQSQAFIDGNKRTAVMAALTFLKLNKKTFPGNSKDLYEAMIAIANRTMNREGLAKLFRVHANPKNLNR